MCGSKKWFHVFWGKSVGFHWPKSFFSIREWLWQKIYLRILLNVSQLFLDGFTCFGHASSVENEGDFFLFSCDLVSFFPSAEVMSDSVNIWRYNLQLFRSFRMDES